MSKSRPPLKPLSPVPTLPTEILERSATALEKQHEGASVFDKLPRKYVVKLRRELLDRRRTRR